MISARDWARGFARQADADLNAYYLLRADGSTSICQAYHFLQMACEKACKAYLCRNGSDPADVQSSHAYIAKIIPQVALRRSLPRSGRHAGKPIQLLKQVRMLSREIELLQPSVDDNGKRPDNCEYPWQHSDDQLVVPIDHSFPGLDLMDQPAGFHLLKILGAMIAELT